MARMKLKARIGQTVRRKRAMGARARIISGAKTMKTVANARPRHKFVVSRFRPEDFKCDGLRSYAHYRDLGVKDATRGMVVPHVIRFVEPCDPK